MTIQPVTLIVPAWMMMASVATTAATMPPVDSWLPRRAVAGVFIRCRPSTKQLAAATYTSWTIQSKALMTRSRRSLPDVPARPGSPARRS